MLLTTISVALALLLISITHRIYTWRNRKCDGILPPGSMGLPLIGETLHLMVTGHSLDLLPFLKKRFERYGPIFRTNVAGRAVVVSADPKFNHFIVQQDGILFESWYLDSFAKLFNQEGISTNVSHVHKYVRGSALRQFGAGALKDRLLPLMERLVRETLANWSTQPSIEVRCASAKVAREFGAKQLFSFDPKQSPEDINELYETLAQGLMAIPLNIPGTSYDKCLKNRKKAIDMIRNILRERQASQDTRRGDYLDLVMQDMDEVDFLTEDFVVQLFFGLVFVISDSTASTVTLTLKLLEEHPTVFQELAASVFIAEHDAVLKNREDSSDSSLSWEEYRSMSFTHHVIDEVLRLGNMSPGLFRRALKDVQFDGYTIPKGWAIMLATSAQHLDPQTYQDPLKFDPWRWTKPKSDEKMKKNLMPFGGGMKQCAGAEYARVLAATFFHVLVTKYRWSWVKGGEVYRNPFLGFEKGLHIKFMEKGRI